MRKKEENEKFVKDLLPSAIAVAIIWLVFTVEQFLPFSLAKYGILPKTAIGLRGIALSPFIHGDITHLAGNSLPLAVLLFYLFSVYRELAYRIVFWTIMMTGVWVWASARESYHIGASGIIYGLASFLFFSGLLRRNNRLMAVSMSVAFFYGSFIWGVFPIEEHISWESHLWGAVSGAVLTIYYKKEGPQRVKHVWEQMSEEEYLQDNVQRYGEFYWDPVKHAEIMRAKEEQHNTAPPQYMVIYHFVPTPQQEPTETHEIEKGRE
ncbi:MAG: rhomboid family intramembrane serine protease [Bacteroidota bacterium]